MVDAVGAVCQWPLAPEALSLLPRWSFFPEHPRKASNAALGFQSAPCAASLVPRCSRHEYARASSSPNGQYAHAVGPVPHLPGQL